MCTVHCTLEFPLRCARLWYVEIIPSSESTSLFIGPSIEWFIHASCLKPISVIESRKLSSQNVELSGKTIDLNMSIWMINKRLHWERPFWWWAIVVGAYDLKSISELWTYRNIFWIFWSKALSLLHFHWLMHWRKFMECKVIVWQLVKLHTCISGILLGNGLFKATISD